MPPQPAAPLVVTVVTVSNQELMKRFRLFPSIMCVCVCLSPKMLGTLTALPIKVPQVGSLRRLTGQAAAVLPQVIMWFWVM